MGAVGMMEYCCAEVGTYKDCSLVGKSPSFPTQLLPPTPTNHTNLSMSFDNSSSCMDNVLGMLHGESSTIPPSHYKAPARTPASRPRGHQTPKPPRTSGFPRQAVTPTIPFNVNGYKLRRGDRYLPCPLLAEVSGRAQSKAVRHDRFKDLYLRDFVHAGKMIWRDRYRNVESVRADLGGHLKYS